jgi:NADPH-dependent 2,4-dienoyl-CoA reductase/sulfur reductase-like enzyme
VPRLPVRRDLDRRDRRHRGRGRGVGLIEVGRDDVVVVGNGVSAYACAKRLGEHGRRTVMIGPGLPHDRPPLSKHGLRTGVLPILADVESLADQGIAHVDGVVRGLDLGARRLGVDEGGGDLDWCPVEGPLVWATGLEYTRPPIPGLERADSNSTGPAFRWLCRRLGTARSVLIVGAGLIGVETAAALAPDYEVTLVELEERPLHQFHDPIPGLAGDVLESLGVTFLGGCEVEEASSRDAGNRWLVRTRSHGDLEPDVVIVAAGIASSLPGELGNGNGTLRVDEAMRVRGHDGLWACGDCTSVAHPRYGEIAFPHWDWARRTGVQAAESVLGIAGPFDAEPFWFSNIGPLHLQELGFGDSAEEWEERDGLHVGRDAAGEIAAVLVLSAARLREARALLAAREGESES